MPLRSTAAKRYAEAVAALAGRDGSWERWRRDLVGLARVLQDRGVYAALRSERLSRERKRELVEGAAPELAPEARSLALVMARRRRLDLLPDVVAWFDDLADRALGVWRVTVTTATPLTEEQRERLRRRLRAALAPGGRAAPAAAGPAGPPGAPPAGEVLLEERVDPAILGGLVVQQADVIRDYSVKARLEALRERLN